MLEISSLQMFRNVMQLFYKHPTLPHIYPYQALRKRHFQFISNNLSKYFEHERLQVDVKTYEMESGMYVTYFKDLYPTTTNKLPLVVVGEPMMSSFGILYPPTISNLLRKYSRIYVIDLPGVGMNNETKMVDSYLAFRDTLPKINPAYRLKASLLTGRMKYVAGSHDHEYLEKIDKIRKFYFDDAFDEFITRHQFEKIDMLTVSMSSYFVIKFFENYHKSIVNKLHIIGDAPLTKSIHTMSRTNPVQSVDDVENLPQYDPGWLLMTLSYNKCLMRYLRFRVYLKIISHQKYLSEGELNSAYEHLEIIKHILHKRHEKEFDVFSDVAYNLFTGSSSPFEDYLLTYEKYDKFININSYEIYETDSWENTVVEEDEECLPFDLKSTVAKSGGILVDGRDADLIQP